MHYSRLVEVYEKLEATTKRLAQTHIISEFLKTISSEDLGTTVLLIEGRVFPRGDQREIGIASKMMLKAISVASGESKERINSEWKKTGDLGTVSYNLIKKKKQATLGSSELTIKKVLKNLRGLVTIEGLGSVDKKIQLVAELLTSAKPSEAKYIVRTILDDMRIGVGEGTIRDSIAWAFFGSKMDVRYNKDENKIEIEDREKYNKYVGAVQRAYDLTNDFAPVAEAAKKHGMKGLEEIEMEIGIPIKVMLALKVEDISEGFKRCGKPAEFEFKYDGMRMQIHKDDNKVKIFTRRLENVTEQFPEVVESVKKHVDEKKVVLDSEAVGFSKKTGKYLPFQNISQRIKRKYDIHKLASELPVELNVFDIINYKGKSVVNMPFVDRKKILKKIIKEDKKSIVLAKSITTDDEKIVQKFYNEAIDAGNEGLMVKKLDAPYKPGARVGFMCKLKSEQEPWDLVIVKAEWGEGKRSKWLSSFTLACIDEEGKFLEVGKASTGLKEKREEGLSFDEMTVILKKLIKKEEGKEVILKPKIVIEVGYEEIQKSPTYGSGYALRFPRVGKLREDKSAEEIATLSMIETAYNKQKKK
ncbi:MAG: ATP-dependent DNA ligase [Candidatus Woesearchaeota archaeon]|jgi:DNA ligase-1|nr:ATP-dependent DNA ligase [Candidatus Woesearchaeota archaeon]MDP7622633.1 ATP-dependent DNA ligase [Candidatus Woesearchaeota archaeon]HJN57333.1 ATP-dependent DNA ligase [Candidatus Woesearchaeota archaeon]|tara:strand:- start:14970 stop:16727 length:1758 start_codon:yes stop_codon:yes gene_type:complete